jgi:hypothetical protein
MKPQWVRALFRFTLLLFIDVHSFTTFAQGSLSPPGAPAPVMKTLDQIEPRTPISSTPFTITVPGSYYLTTNLPTDPDGGITISTSFVTLDLNGFTLSGTNGPGGTAIVSIGGYNSITIRNGGVRLSGGHGIYLLSANNIVLRDLRVYGSSANGIATGPNSTVINCSSVGNLGYGIYADTGSTVSGCTANLNGSSGINVREGCTVNGCTAYYNNSGAGIFAAADSTVTASTARTNLYGIIAGPGATVSTCTANGNQNDGIQISSSCSVLNNTACNNGFTGSLGTQGGIHATGNGNRIDGNHTFGNFSDGILVDAAGRKNFVIRNTSGQNTGFQFRVPGLPGQPPAGANVAGPVVNDATNASANAWANFQQ